MERLNRDLAKVIVIDWNSSWTQSQPNNTLIIPRWNVDDNDNYLIDLADFLKGLIFNIIFITLLHFCVHTYIEIEIYNVKNLEILIQLTNNISNNIYF